MTTFVLATLLLAADLPTREILRVDAEEPDALARLVEGDPTRLLTDRPEEVLAGRRSLKGDSTRSNDRWNEYLHSRVGLFGAGEAYTVSFDYKVLSRAADAMFYCLFRGEGARQNEGWLDWRGEPGETGRLTAEIWTGRRDKLYFILGIAGRGAIVVDNLVIRAEPARRPPDFPLPNPTRTWTSPGDRTYHVDALAGDDGADGLTPATAWRTLERVNQGVFGPGDRILLRSGGAWTGYLAPGGRGAAGRPLVIGRYGEGPKPKIDAQGRWKATVYLKNVDQVELRELDVANFGERRQAGRCGVQVRLENFGDARRIHLLDLDVHDVNGSNVKADGGGCGILIDRAGGETPSRYIDLLIQGCRLERCDRNGIIFWGPWSRREWHPSLEVVIRGNTLLDIGGDGIVPIGCDGALIEHNVLRGGRMRCADAAAGIWPWSCDNTVIQHNEVSGMRGTVDGQGFDSDWNCRNTLIQYNYSHDNEGGFLLVCNDGNSKMPWNIGNVGTIARYNISRNDGARTFHISGPVENTLIHNNVIYLGPGRNVPLLQPGNWGGAWPRDTRFQNNIFLIEGRSRIDLGQMIDTVFAGNIFRGAIDGVPAGNLTIDPGLLAPGTGGDGFASLTGYRLRPDSPCLGAGVAVPEPGQRDFWGQPLPATGPLDIGAEQRPR